jgi:hypothetical protein
MLNWLDSHAGAVTALATIVLVAITAAYVAVTYMLVREQRLQGQVPAIIHGFVGDWKEVNADLRLHNVGNGAAAEVTVLLGPGDGIPVEMPVLGERRSLMPEKEFICPIRPFAGARSFEAGLRPLTIYYFDNNRSKVFFKVLLLKMARNDEGWTVRNLGSIASTWTRREFKWMVGKSLALWRRPGFHWKVRHWSLPHLVLNDDARSSRSAWTNWSRSNQKWNRCGARSRPAQTASKTVARPWPTPTHMVAMP